MEKEIDKLRKKYDALIQETEREHVRRSKEIEMMYSKVSKHQELAERFREIFNETIEEARNDYPGMTITIILFPLSSSILYSNLNLPASIHLCSKLQKAFKWIKNWHKYLCFAFHACFFM